MSDLALRAAGRTLDSAAALAWRLRTNELDRRRVAYSASLGHEVALQVVEPAVLPAEHLERAEQAARLLGRVDAARWARALADLTVTHAWTEAAPNAPTAGMTAVVAEVESAARWAEFAARPKSTMEEWEVTVGAAATAAVLSGAITWPEVLADLAEMLIA